ncbi:hypothetical protein QE152_g36816 [Popillia japonica]|uniref:Uncharacterized protein n=1 Tax=Popillia japonica TaxID=7064 RepID=A0AAW1ICG5_POPJA
MPRQSRSNRTKNRSKQNQGHDMQEKQNQGHDMQDTERIGDACTRKTKDDIVRKITEWRLIEERYGRRPKFRMQQKLQDREQWKGVVEELQAPHRCDHNS